MLQNCHCVNTQIRKQKALHFHSAGRPTPSCPPGPVHPRPSTTRLGKQTKGQGSKRFPGRPYLQRCGPTAASVLLRAQQRRSGPHTLDSAKRGRPSGTAEGQPHREGPQSLRCNRPTKLRQRGTRLATPEAGAAAVPAGMGGGSQGRSMDAGDCGRGKNQSCQ